ncbi:MAG: histidinol-phosphatase HisJ family protein [Clostridia bacterium]|nr:histidinol-phosphatase HisJ family protein [Clostridia bacterium]
MQKFLTDIHTHSKFSSDGRDELAVMLSSAQEKGVGFYGVAEHFNYEQNETDGDIDADAYFHTARHLQEDYAGVMNVLVGAEFGFGKKPKAHALYLEVCEKYSPDFIVNSVHMLDGVDYYFKHIFYNQEKGERVLRDRKEVYEEYLSAIYESLFVPYPYDIVGHIGYAGRYAPYEQKGIAYAEFKSAYDRILKEIVARDKILELNGKGLIPSADVLAGYYALGGRKVSYASDAHDTKGQLVNRERAMGILKEIGFTYLTVPCRGEHIKVEI